MKRALFPVLAALLLAGLGCGPSKSKEVSSLQRKEAATLVSEAEFALSVRDLPRAEGLYAKAAALCPDEGEYWLALGSVRVKQGNRGAARGAYKSALAAYEKASADGKDTQPVLQHIYVLALLGRADEARTALDRAQKKFPADRDVRTFAEGKQLERMLADPRFKEIAL
jgi:tetratricopeptide (TPR) repeat protein